MKFERANAPMETFLGALSTSTDILTAEAFLIAESMIDDSTVSSSALAFVTDDAAFDSAVRRWRRSARSGSFQVAA